jgi:hypothetical protein
VKEIEKVLNWKVRKQLSFTPDIRRLVLLTVVVAF